MNTTTNTTTSTKPSALFRAWLATVTYRECGVVTDVTTYTVTMSRTQTGIVATVNGKEVDVLTADRILSNAQADNGLTVTAEIFDTPTPTIGKARAHRLHKIMGRLGLHDHYGVARRATGQDIFSLAQLTEEQAKEVWAYLTNMFPDTAWEAAA